MLSRTSWLLPASARLNVGTRNASTASDRGVRRASATRCAAAPWRAARSRRRGDPRPAHLRAPTPSFDPPRQGRGARHGHSAAFSSSSPAWTPRSVASKRSGTATTQAIASGRLAGVGARGDGFAEPDQRKWRLGVVHRGAATRRTDCGGPRPPPRPRALGAAALNALALRVTRSRRGQRRGRPADPRSIAPRAPAQPRQKRMLGKTAHGVVASSDARTTCSCPRSSGCAFR